MLRNGSEEYEVVSYTSYTKDFGRDALIQNLWWGTTEKLGKPSGLKDTDEADWVPDVCLEPGSNDMNCITVSPACRMPGIATT